MDLFCCIIAWGRFNSHLDKILKQRISLINFLNVPAVKKWVKREHFTMLEYWEKLFQYKYSICPPGNGVQSPKIVEAILTHTVPVTIDRPAYQDLKSLGLPILLISDWNELSVSFLMERYEKDFRSTDWENAKKMLAPSSIMQLLLNWKKRIPIESAYRKNMSAITLRRTPRVQF